MRSGSSPFGFWATRLLVWLQPVALLLCIALPARAQDTVVPLRVGDGPLPLLEAELRARCVYREAGFDCSATLADGVLRAGPFAGPLDGRAELRITPSRVQLVAFDATWQAGPFETQASTFDAQAGASQTPAETGEAQAGRADVPGGGQPAAASAKSPPTLPIRLSGAGYWSSGGTLELTRLAIAADGLQGSGTVRVVSGNTPEADLRLTVSDKGRFLSMARRLLPEALSNVRPGRSLGLRMNLSESDGGRRLRLSTLDAVRVRSGGQWATIPPVDVSLTGDADLFRGRLEARGTARWSDWTVRGGTASVEASLGPGKVELHEVRIALPEGGLQSGDSVLPVTGVRLSGVYDERREERRDRRGDEPPKEQSAPKPGLATKERPPQKEGRSQAAQANGTPRTATAEFTIVADGLATVRLTGSGPGLLPDSGPAPASDDAGGGESSASAGRRDSSADRGYRADAHGRKREAGASAKTAGLARWRWVLEARETDLEPLGGLLAAAVPAMEGWMFSGLADIRAELRGNRADARIALREAGFMSADGETLGDRLEGTLELSKRGSEQSLTLDVPRGEALKGIYYCNFSKYPLRATVRRGGGAPSEISTRMDWQGVGRVVADGTLAPVEDTANGPATDGGPSQGDPSPKWRYAGEATLDVPDLAGPFTLFVSGPRSMEGASLSGGASLRVRLSGAGEDAAMHGRLQLADAAFSSPSMTISGINLDLPMEYVFGPGGSDGPAGLEGDGTSAPGTGPASGQRLLHAGKIDAGMPDAGKIDAGKTGPDLTDAGRRGEDSGGPNNDGPNDDGPNNDGPNDDAPTDFSSQTRIPQASGAKAHATGPSVPGSSMTSDAEGDRQPPRWGSLRIDSVESGFAVARGLESPAALVPGRLLLPGDLSAVVYGGTVELTDTVVLHPLSSWWRLRSHVSLRDISMAAMQTGALLLDGALGGDLGQVELSAKRLRVPGRVTGSFFGGDLRMDGLYMTDPFRPSREYGCSIVVDDLDMERLSGALGIGRITGALDLDARNLVMAYGQPASFDLTVRSDEDADADRTVSLEAVNSLSVIGTGTGLAGVGVGVFASFFREFSYKYIGFRCVLKNDTFRVRGLKTEGGQEYLIRKPFLFGINVVNSNPNNVISFSDMLERIERVVNPSSSMEFGTPEAASDTSMIDSTSSDNATPGDLSGTTPGN